MRLRGIIDRLDLTPDGELVVIDYKTGRAPGPAFEQSKLAGVHIYALLCQEVLGRRPVQVRLLHLKEPMTITAEPSEQALRGQRQKAVAVWSAIERACENEDFRPRTSPLCNYCRFREFCPAYGGQPEQAAVVARSGAVGWSGMSVRCRPAADLVDEADPDPTAGRTPSARMPSPGSTDRPAGRQRGSSFADLVHASRCPGRRLVRALARESEHGRRGQGGHRAR